jgi:hypothetical protein
MKAAVAKVTLEIKVRRFEWSEGFFMAIVPF